ncbi:MAG: recombinase family protein [Lachnospiraceae bacterium]|nr:recombinase family protein [Lachnospiraceae bacterium]
MIGRGKGGPMLRVAAYCRVSTDREEQSNSFESQREFFREWIARNPEWELVEIFADEGISGTGTKKRKEFNRMIAAAKAGQIDLILTKEVSRFARNTVDTLQYTRDLRKIGVYVYFLSDNIHTKDPSAELRLTIMASVAQEESRKTSERVKWGQRRRMEQGVVFGRDLLGYRVKNGKLEVHEDEAEIVRLIFSKFLNEGKGAYVIAGELTAAKVPTAPHMKGWSGVNILRILKNEKYCGDLVQKKTYTPDYLSHEKKYNRGEEELVVLRNHHEAIVSREIFMRVQEELGQRAALKQKKARHSGVYPLSGKVICGECGSVMVARSKPRGDGSRYLAWRCPKAMGSQPQCGLRRQIGNQILVNQIGTDMSDVEKVIVWGEKCLDVYRKS